MGKLWSHIVLSTLSIILTSSFSYSQIGVVAGKIKYGTEPLQSANVSLGNETTHTNQKGEFSFSVKPGIYTIIVTHVSYNKIEQLVTVEAGSALSLTFHMIPNQLAGEIVVVGSRSLVRRSNLNTPVPVDVFSSAQLLATGQITLMQMLNFTAPSVNASMQIMTEPVTLRGLDPDHTLILLNGTRYHNIAYMNPGVPRGQLGRGSVGNDLNTIPFSAIEKVEILRDGASAQYGSDAIAGVVNTRLKESTGKMFLSLHLGQQYKGDGEKFKLGIYRGFDLNKQGFVSFSADVHYREPSFRGGEYKGTVYKNIPPATSYADSIRIRAEDDSVIKARGFYRKNASNGGTTKSASVGFLLNGAYRVSGETELFWTGTVNYQALSFQNNYTLPRNTAVINTLLFPNGFKAMTKPVSWNVSGIAGARGVLGRGVHWEYSTAYGMNSIRYDAENTNNASQQGTLGKNAQTNFYMGLVNYHQLTNTIHFTKNVNNPNKSNTINLGWGAEWRYEKFEMQAGEDASWKNFDTTLKKMGGVTGAAQIISGYDALDRSRSVMCGYTNIEADLDDRFLLGLAARYEYYTDFGGNVAGKIAARYKLFNKLSLRGSFSNGFRAPSIQQRYYSAITNGIRTVPGGGQTSTKRGIFNNEHEITRVFGVSSLAAEKSLNLSGGLTSTLSKDIYLTIDAYWIQIKNRIVLSGAFDRVTNPEVDSLLKTGSVNGYPDIQQVSFFSNAINTRTKGIDIVIHGKWKIAKAQLVGSLAANFTKTRLFGEIKEVPNLSKSTLNVNSLFDDEQRSDMEYGQPQSKIILVLNYQKEKIGFNVRNTRFGETAYQFSYPRPMESFSPKILTDMSICFTPKSWLSITTGANNIFNVYPDPIKNYVNTGEGRYIYALDVWQFGFMGGYYYVSTSLNF